MDIKELDINKIKRYLGYDESRHALTDNIQKLIDIGIKEVLETIDPKVIFSPVLKFQEEDNLIYVGNLVLKGNDIKAHLKNCSEVLLMGVTLGSKIDNLIRKTEMIDMAKAVIIEAISNVAIETAADKFEEEYRQSLRENNKYLTMRYSPGYGDLPIDTQQDLIRILDAPRKIGLTVTSSNIMIPRKSITAILGVADIDVKGKQAGCKNCVLREKCVYRERGKTCE